MECSCEQRLGVLQRCGQGGAGMGGVGWCRCEADRFGREGAAKALRSSASAAWADTYPLRATTVYVFTSHLNCIITSHARSGASAS